MRALIRRDGKATTSAATAVADSSSSSYRIQNSDDGGYNNSQHRRMPSSSSQHLQHTSNYNHSIQQDHQPQFLMPQPQPYYYPTANNGSISSINQQQYEAQ